MLHINLESNHFTEIHCYNTDASEVTLTRFSDLKCSVKHVFLVCGRRQCMSEVWLGANGLLKQTELRGTLKSGQSSNICSTSLLKIQRGLCLKRLLKADVLSVYQVILLPQSDVSSFSGGWSKKVPAERVWADSPTLPLGKTSHCNAGAIWGSLYKAVVNGRSLFHSPGRRAGPWGWLWWCAVA